ncbi:MAG: COX15/CtaA family protein [Rhodobacterales bacterium]|jgi:cytochrome c oxidase assembly protein subunit 15|nr:COX15/CtaA family protein [Rhodobacterales bacterium]
MAVKPRSIFEEVPTSEKIVAQPGGIDRGRRDGRRAIRIWLMVLFGMVMLMIAVGGMTRLTDSGLSITEWAPVTGAVPPMNEEAWQQEFTAYQATDQYKLTNAGMTLDEFKSIYWWEWGHRQLGRVMGLVWAVGFAWFLVRRQIPPGWTPRLLLVGGLGGLQGAIGWWMVHGGLQAGMISVPSYRLATHLGLAFLILGLLAWYVFLLGRRETDLLQARRAGEIGLFRLSSVLMGLTYVQIILGALVAGIDAGRAFPTWPLMGGEFLPPEPFSIEPVWRNFFEDPGLVQFIHRTWGYLVFAVGIWVWFSGRNSPNIATRFSLNAMLAMLFAQILLGIITVLYSAPVQVAIVHQIGAVVLWVLILRSRYLARYPLPQSVRG